MYVYLSVKRLILHTTNPLLVSLREATTNRNYYDGNNDYDYSYNSQGGISSLWEPLYRHLRRYKRGISLQKFFRKTKTNFQGLSDAVTHRFDRLSERFFKEEQPQHVEHYEYYPQYDEQQHYYGQQDYNDPNAISEDELFGFRVRVRLVDKQPCTLGVTCFEDEFENDLRFRNDPFEDVDFNSLGGDPDRVLSYNNNNNNNNNQEQNVFGSRQTNEEFSSDAPPDCRTELNPNGCVGGRRRSSSAFFQYYF